MSTTARQIRSKINRAHENIEEFQARSAAFNKANPHIIVSQEDPKAGQRIWFVAYVPEIPETLAGPVADAIGNLCKPLDYIASRIEGSARGKQSKDIYFPVGRDAANYMAQRGRYIHSAGQAAVDAFDAAEPYKGGRGEALWQLHELNNPDKHTAPLAVSGAYTGFDIGPTLRDTLRAQVGQGWDPANIEQLGSIFMKPRDRLCPLKVGDKLFGEPLGPKMNEERKFLLEIAFHEPGVIECEPALEALQKFADAVSGIAEAFEPLLP